MELNDICIALDYINKLEAKDRDLQRSLDEATKRAEKAERERNAANDCIFDIWRKVGQKDYFSAWIRLSDYCDPDSTKEKGGSAKESL